MSVKKRVLLLAHSDKPGGRCIAGREIVSLSETEYQLGSWVRPLSNRGEGAISAAEYQYPNGKSAAVMDIAEIPLKGNLSDACQPENWRLDASERWTNVTAAYTLPNLTYCVEAPPDLWLQPGGKTDSVAHDYLVAHPPSQSLYVISLERLNLRLSSERWDGNVRPNYRCQFHYNGVEYVLKLTDPVVKGRYKTQVPKLGALPFEVDLASGGNVCICVSLAGEFKEKHRHYKVVATIFEGYQ